MTYILSNAATRAEVDRTEAASDFAAIARFRERLARQADQDDFLVARADGTVIAHFVRTVAGQWYAISKSDAPAPKRTEQPS